VDMLRRVYAGEFDKALLPKSDNACLFIESLLVFEPKDRLNDDTIITHPYFSGLDWDKLERGELVAPWVPRTSPTDPWATESIDAGSPLASNKQTTTSPATATSVPPNPFAPPPNPFAASPSSPNAPPSPANPFAPVVAPVKRTLMDYIQNFDASLDEKERYRMIESNLRLLGFGDDSDHRDSDEEFAENEPTPEQQKQFAKWTYNAHAPHSANLDDIEEDYDARMPQFATLLAASALSPSELRLLVSRSSDETLAQLCFEMRQVHEAFITENFRHMAAELRAESLHNKLQQIGRDSELSASELHRRPSNRPEVSESTVLMEDGEEDSSQTKAQQTT